MVNVKMNKIIQIHFQNNLFHINKVGVIVLIHVFTKEIIVVQIDC